MRCVRLVVTVLLTLTAGAAAAQTDAQALSPLEMATACQLPPSYDGPPEHALLIIGSQDAMPRSLFGNRDLLVIGGGTADGVQLGQQFFVRRSSRFGSTQGGRGHSSKTLGWIRVVAVNESTAIATVDHVCGGMVRTDYLDPFIAPVLPAGADRDEAPGEPDFTSLSRIVIGNEDRTHVGAGDFALIDRGSEQGLIAGTRFAVYRDVGPAGMPLASIGEGIVISMGPSMALTRITRVRDAVRNGDYVALRK
jgi:hypothetical protein